jgi:hypothetical protein
MEYWWMRNKTHIEHYGIKSDGHACITTVQDETLGEDLKYMESQQRIRELLKTCALKNKAFLPEPHSWFAKLGEGMKSFVEKHRSPKRRDVLRVLTRRCKLDPETARKIADMMEKGDTETNYGNQDEQVGNNLKEGEGRSNPVVGKNENELVKNAAKSDAPPTSKQYGDVKTEPRHIALEVLDGGRPKMNLARDNSLAILHAVVKAEPRHDALEGLDGGPKMNLARVNAPAIQHAGVKAEPRHDALEVLDGGRPKMNLARDNSLVVQHGRVMVEPRHDVLEGVGGGRPKINGDDGDQSLDSDAGVVEQAKSKQDDTKKKPGVASKVWLQSQQVSVSRDLAHVTAGRPTRRVTVARRSTNLPATRSAEPKSDHGAGNVRANVCHPIELTSAFPRTYIVSRGPIALNAASHRRTFW